MGLAPTALRAQRASTVAETQVDRSRRRTRLHAREADESALCPSCRHGPHNAHHAVAQKASRCVHPPSSVVNRTGAASFRSAAAGELTVPQRLAAGDGPASVQVVSALPVGNKSRLVHLVVWVTDQTQSHG